MLQNKYLPIGTVCVLTGSNQKIMITGYQANHFEGKIVTSDYIGCAYPEGMLLNQWFYFQHQQIQNVEFLGFMNDQYRVFCNRIDNNQKENNTGIGLVDTKNVVIHDESNDDVKYQFDENGIVISDGTITEEPTYQFDVHEEVNTTPVNNGEFKFDENGTVISDGTTNGESRYQFDANGTVTADSSEDISAKIDSLYQFDENGVVISDNSVSNQTESSSGYKFDENGTVIADETSNSAPTTSGGFQFDENGVVIAEL